MRKPDCRTCGACCVGFQERGTFCDLTAEDIKRLSKSFALRAVGSDTPIGLLLLEAVQGVPISGVLKTKELKVRTGPLKGYRLNTCVALKGSVLNRVTCAIYKNRPAVCRNAIQPGDSNCREVRKAFRAAIESLGQE